MCQKRLRWTFYDIAVISRSVSSKIFKWCASKIHVTNSILYVFSLRVAVVVRIGRSFSEIHAKCPSQMPTL